MDTSEQYSIDTLAVHLGRDETDQTGALAPPIHPAAAFVRPSLERPGQYFYSRRGNPTRTALETAIARLHRGSACFAFGSGMAAVTAVSSLLNPGDRVILPTDVYGNTHRLYTDLLAAKGISASFVDLRSLSAFRDALRSPAALVWLESPTNPRMFVLDIAAISELAREAGAQVAVDNSFASPYFQRPLDLGADLVVESTTKYLNGHDDLMGGAVVVSQTSGSESRLIERLTTIQYVGGAVPSPFDCWLILRGMKTLALRMERHQTNALAIAEYLQSHARVSCVNYPGLPTDPGHALAKRQMTGFGGMLSFEVRGGEREAKQIVERTHLFQLAGGLGGVESLISHPGTQASASQANTPLAVSPALIRLSIGIEHQRDLIADLERALDG